MLMLLVHDLSDGRASPSSTEGQPSQPGVESPIGEDGVIQLTDGSNGSNPWVEDAAGSTAGLCAGGK